MSKGIETSSVKHIARLARLSLSTSEIRIYTRQLKEVLDYMTKLKKVNTKKVKPTYQVIDNSKNVFRNDKVKKGLTQKQALSQAGRTHQGYFLTESVFGAYDKGLKTVNRKRKIIDDLNAVLTEVDSDGVIGHKDLFLTEGIETTAGSKVLAGYLPSYSSTVVRLLENSGRKTKYKLNQDAWGHGSSGENSDFGPSKNPWNSKKVPGGSSSGSACVVSTGKVMAATATDTCGSIRLPAAFTNTCGIKPTYGAVSRWGVIAFASSLDCPGLIARDVMTLKKLFKEIAREDIKDATSQNLNREKAALYVKTIGVVREMIGGGVDVQILEAIKEAIEVYRSLGYKVKSVSLPHADLGIAAYYLIATTETASNLARYDGIRFGNHRGYFGAEAKRRIMLGTYASSAGYQKKFFEKAARVRTLMINDLNKAFSEVEAIIAPVAPSPPFDIGENVNDPLKLYLMDIFAAPASLAGIPSLALPCGFTKDNLPIGMQLMGPRWCEEALFELGRRYQKVTGWHKKNPPKL